MTTDTVSSCSICSTSNRDAFVVTGPHISICSKCVHSGITLFLFRDLSAAEKVPDDRDLPARSCNFCERTSAEVAGLVGNRSLAICPECLGTTVQIMAEHAISKFDCEEMLALPPHLA